MGSKVEPHLAQLNLGSLRLHGWHEKSRPRKQFGVQEADLTMRTALRWSAVGGEGRAFILSSKKDITRDAQKHKEIVLPPFRQYGQLYNIENWGAVRVVDRCLVSGVCFTIQVHQRRDPRTESIQIHAKELLLKYSGNIQVLRPKRSTLAAYCRRRQTRFFDKRKESNVLLYRGLDFR